MNSVSAKLGQMVTYVGTAGTSKAAMVVATPDTVAYSGTPAVPALAMGEVHLMVFSATGNVYMKRNVSMGPFETPSGDVVSTNVWHN